MKSPVDNVPGPCANVRGQLCQTQHILHAIEARFLRGKPPGGADGAAGEGVAAMGAVDEFEAFADAAEDDGVLADDVAGAHGKQRNFLFAPGTDDAFAAIDADPIQVAIERLRH